ncbi:hypothetical protein C5B97_00680 [Pseudoclavibacter sp. RFBB5]|nr:hypothetical protein C5B97_00680 [Pseudoclavibacter sp. RFBB5]
MESGAIGAIAAYAIPVVRPSSGYSYVPPRVVGPSAVWIGSPKVSPRVSTTAIGMSSPGSVPPVAAGSIVAKPGDDSK